MKLYFNQTGLFLAFQAALMFVYIVSGLVILAALLLGVPYFFMYAWNIAVSPVFSMPKITYLQGAILYYLWLLLFKPYFYLFTE